MLSAIIFDFDGTLADTLTEARIVLNEMADEFSFTPITAEEVAGLRGLTVDGLIKHLGIKRRHVPIILARGRRALRSRIAQIQPHTGILSILPKLREHSKHFGILTSNSSENVELFLETHGIRDLFTFISSTTALKGKSRHLRSIARTFSVTPSSMLYIGDEVRDINAATKATVPSVAVDWGFNSAQSLATCRPTHLISNPSQLLEIVRPQR